MSQLKVGIIGLGIGEKHLEAFQGHPECEVVALCDLSTEKLGLAETKYPSLILSTKADELLQNPDIDVISIASYDNYHYTQIVHAIEYNKHVFVEKPLCQYRTEAEHIRRLLSEKPGLRMSSNLPLRTAPRFQELKLMIENGSMGQLFYVEGDYNYGRLHKITEGWRGQIDFYSVFYGGGVHMIDLLLWLTSGRIVEVAAYGTNIASSNTNFRYNDTVVSILKFENGMIGKVTSNFACVFPHFHNLQIYGAKATFINNEKYGILIESRDPAQPPRKVESPYPGKEKGSIIHSFVDSILGTSEPEVTIDDVFETMSVCYSIEQAAQQSGSVMVEYL